MSKTDAAKTPTVETFENLSRSPERSALAAAIAERNETEAAAAAFRRAQARARDDRVRALGEVEAARGRLAEAREAARSSLVGAYIDGDEGDGDDGGVAAAEAALAAAERRYSDLKTVSDGLSARKDEAGSHVPALRVAEAVRAVVKSAPVVRRLVNDYRAAERAFQTYHATLVYLAGRRMIPDDLARAAPSRDATCYGRPDPAFVAAIDSLGSNADAQLPD